MKKILIIPSWYPNNAIPEDGTFFLEQARLASKAFDIKVICGFRKRNISRLKKLLNSLKYILTRMIVSRCKPGYFYEPPKVIGFEYECGLNVFQRSNYRITIHAYLAEINRLIKYWKPDLIHAQDTSVAGICAFHSLRHLNIPYVITEHNYMQFRFPEYILKDFIKAMESSLKVCLVSEYQMRNLLMYGVKCRNEITGNFVDERLFKLNDQRIHKDTFNILYVGRQAFHKDFPTLWNTITEFDRISISKDYTLTIIGSSLNEILIPAEVSDLFSSGRIIVAGSVSRSGILPYFQSADVYLSTSIAETFGVGICEAMMCGIPVVSTNNGGFDEMYIPGINGIKTNIGDFKTLALSLYKIKTGEIIFDPVKIRNSVLDKFGTQAFKKRLSEIYNSVNG